MGKYIDEGGVENVAVGIVNQAKKDFIKGGKILYGMMKCIPTYNELIANPDHHTLSNNADVRWMYDSWRFVRDDPYQFFGDVEEEDVINAWKNEAIKEYYKVLYLKGGTILYAKHVHKKDIRENDEAIIKAIEDNTIANDFIAARNYILNVPEGEKTFKEWNILAYERSRHWGRTGTGRPSIQNSNYSKEQREKRQKNIKIAKELFESGISDRAIAKELGVTIQCVRNYLRS